MEAEQVTVRDAAGHNVRGAQAFIDRIGQPPDDTLEPGARRSWVVPIHWFWGTRRDSLLSTSFVFDPGVYTIGVTFPDQYRITSAVTHLLVRMPLERDSADRLKFMSAVGRARAAIAAARSLDAAVPILRDAIDDTGLAAYHTILVCDVPATFEGTAPAYSPTFAARMDSLRLLLLGRKAGAPDLARRAECVRNIRALTGAIPDSVLASDLQIRERLAREQVRPN